MPCELVMAQQDVETALSIVSLQGKYGFKKGTF
jgi:hypothetical protein